jgi:hypothetical protein
MSNKPSRKRNPAAGTGAELPPMDALPAEPLAAAPDTAADTLATAKRRRAKPNAADAPAADSSQRSGMQAELIASSAAAANTAPPAAKRSRAKRTAANPPQPEVASDSDQIAAPITTQNAADPAPPAAKRSRAKRTAANPAVDASQRSDISAEALTTSAAAPQPERAALADTTPVAKRSRAKPNTVAAPIAASHSSGMPARPLTTLAAVAAAAQHGQINPAATDAPAPIKRASRRKTTPAKAQELADRQLDTQLAPPPVAQEAHQLVRQGASQRSPAPPVAQAGAIPRSATAAPNPAHTITARSTKMESLAALRTRFPLSNDALSVFGLSAIFLIGLLLGFLLLEKNVRALEARAPVAALIAQDTSAQPNMTPTSRTATATPVIEARPAALLVSTPVSTRPTSVPTPTQPSAPPAPTQPLPTATPSIAELLQRVATAEQTLSAGSIEAMLDYSNGSSASAQLRFDIGSSGQKQRFWIRSTYTGTNGSQVIEHLTIGDQGWERQPDGRWLVGQPQEAIIDQLRVYLPQSDQITQAEQSSDSDTTTLCWYDASRNADMSLTIDQDTGVPRELRRIVRESGVKLVVVYAQWNAPVDIAAPQ